MAGLATAPDERLVRAHDALVATGDVQFDLPAVPPKPAPPEWLRAFGEWLERALAPLGRMLRWIGSHMPDAPYARIFLWTVLALLVALIVWTVVDRVRHGVWRLPRRPWRARAAPVGDDEDDWAPEAGAARAWLESADALAAQGQYEAAVHHLLLRSVEDLSRRRPKVVRPALTSRELAETPEVPPKPRRLFREIAQAVERSLFGGRAIDAEMWRACRAAYADFAQPGTWNA
ncbi:MAG: DUF4129 domain-containing protein [Sphingobium sp.]